MIIVLKIIFIILQTLVIKSLQETDNGVYKCAIMNESGPGESLFVFNLTVWSEMIISNFFEIHKVGTKLKEIVINCH